MTITLNPKQQAWIDVRVARGEYASTQDAVRKLIVGGMIDRGALEADDLAWAKPLVDEALAEIDRGETISRDEYRASVRDLLATLKD